MSKIITLNKKGQTLVEYVLIIAIITVIAVSLVTYLGGYLKDMMTKATCSMSGREYITGQSVGKAYCGDETNELFH